jgi:signal recognition particle subunit SRP54
MLETISKGFQNARNRLRGFREIDESNIEDALRDIRLSLLEGDVEFHVVKQFLEHVKHKALGEVVQTRIKHAGKAIGVTPGDHFVRICQEQLEELMGPVDTSLAYATVGITKVMMVGLQGSGKTTTAAKLARLLKEKEGREPMLVAADVYRPAAVDQLRVLGERLEIPVFHEPGKSPPQLCVGALAAARAAGCDTLIYDTAGRLAIDDVLMQELERINELTQPENIFLVIDSMIGQDAVKTAKAFNDRLELDGVILTKLDGDARGGAALSVKAVTGKPIKFVGMGEGLDKLEEFRPQGLASRILGMGDIVGLVQDFEQVVDEKKAEEDAKKLLSGDFTFDHFVEQIRTIKKMGSLKEVLEKLPFFGEGLPEGASVDDRELVKVEAIIGSMTQQERDHPALLNESRVRRIAKGSGRTEREVSDLIARFHTMRDMMRQIGQSPGLLGRLPGFRQLAQMKQLKGMDMNALFGGGAPGGPGGMDPLGRAQARGASKHFDREKARKKAKMAKDARKKARKKK